MEREHLSLEREQLLKRVVRVESEGEGPHAQTHLLSHSLTSSSESYESFKRRSQSFNKPEHLASFLPS